MIKKLILSATSIVAMLCFIFTIIYAQDNMEELKTKVRGLREKKAELTISYEEQMHNITRAAEDRMASLSANFKKARREYINEKHKLLKELRLDYEARLKPMISEEEELIQAIGPSEESNFAKTKAERRMPK